MEIGTMACSLSVTRTVLSLVAACYVSAASAAAPQGHLEYASTLAAGQTITISRWPTADSNGTTRYYDVQVVFTINSDGSVNTTPQVTAMPSPSLQVDHFVPGNYIAQSSGPIAVSGPGIDPGAQTNWSLAATSGNCTDPPTATWYTGPISQNPLAQRLKKAKITSGDYSYGIVGNGAACDSQTWGNNSLIGASQVNNTLTLSSFTINSRDQSTPVTTITYTLK